VPTVEENRAKARPLAQVIAATPALRERAAAKEAHLVDLLTRALRDRGVDEETAAIAARTGWGTLARAMRCWHLDPRTGLDAHLQRAFRRLRTIVSDLDRQD
jgi:hypothetical protein